MYLSGGYPLSGLELRDLASKHGLDPDAECLGHTVDRELRRRGVKAELETHTNPDGRTSWYYLLVGWKPLPDVAKADLVKPPEETERDRALKEELGIRSEFVPLLRLGRSYDTDEFVSRMGGDKGLIPHY
jgi:hypothetical protein